MRDLQAMYTDYMEEEAMAGSAGYMLRVASLVQDITEMHDNLKDEGAANFVTTSAEAEDLHCTAADKQWHLHCDD